MSATSTSATPEVPDARIEALEALDVSLPYDPPFVSAWQPGVVQRARRMTFVKLTAAGGVVGWGATGAGPAAFIREHVAPRLVGQSLFAAERHAAALRQAVAAGGGRGVPWAADIALWDAIGRVAGQPLHRLWGAAAGRIPAYASTVAAKPPEARAEDALRYLEAGFRAIKLRAHHPTFEEDVAVVRHVRDAVGDRMAIMVDANQAGAGPARAGPHGVVWDWERARRTADAYAAYGVVWLEEPLPRDRLADLSRLCAATTTPISGGEGDTGLPRFRDLVEQDCYDVLQPDCTVSEGLFQLRKIAALAELHGKDCVPHHGVGAIGLAAHLQLSATLPNCPWVEYILDPPWRTVESYLGMWGVVPEPPRVDPADGCVPVPLAPGHGMAVDEAALRRHAVPG